jgi:glycosyltransferase involved in cell wall biosynthesis
MFDVYAPLVAPEQWAAWGLDQPNIRACGPYKTFSELPVEHYGVFLFTSGFEGLPNVLLEAGAAGLPLVSSAVGGVQELVTPRTGWPVSTECNEAEGLAEALDQALNKPGEALVRNAALRQLLKKRHSAQMYWQTAQAASSFFIA